MSDNQSLDQLWQQQPTKTPDLKTLTKKFRKIMFKQWFYLLADVSSLLFVFVWLYLDRENMSQLLLVYLSLISVLGTGATTYIIWLRRFSLRNTSASTQDYIHGLKKHYANNIKIAEFTKLSLKVLTPIMIIFFFLSAYYNDWDFSTAVKKILIVLFGCGALYGMNAWANRCKRRYIDELAKLELIEQSMMSENNEALS